MLAIAEAVEGSMDDVTLLGLFLATAMLTLIGFNPNPVAPIMEASLQEHCLEQYHLFPH